MKVKSPSTLREYFAAHAPVMPDWFKPNLPEPPKTPKSQEFTKEEDAFMDEYFDFEEDYWKDYVDEDSELYKTVQQKLQEDSRAFRAYDEALETYNERSLKMLALVQWRYAYADAMCLGPDVAIRE